MTTQNVCSAFTLPIRLCRLVSSSGVNGTSRSVGYCVMPNVRAKLPAEACSVSLACEGAEGAAHQAYAACRSGSA